MVKIYTTLITLIFAIAEVIGQVPVIFDTDIAPDYDDVGAMALLHAFADNGEAEILATVSCNVFETTGPTLSVLNTYFKRPGIPIGITKGSAPNENCKQEWAQYINAIYPHALQSNDEAMEAVSLYRSVLAGQPDGSVTIITVGFFTNLSNLLASKPDKYSDLNGTQLVKKKVKQLVSMAASLGKDGKGGSEFNVRVDAAASQKVFAEWPTPMIISGFDIGEKILTGIGLIANEGIQNSPVKDAYSVALSSDRNTAGRNSWDQTAVWVAVRGIEPLFSSRKINFEITPEGKSIPVPGEKFTYLTFRKTPEEIAKEIEELMMHTPR